MKNRCCSNYLFVKHDEIDFSFYIVDLVAHKFCDEFDNEEIWI